jgi:hypothetical protein
MNKKVTNECGERVNMRAQAPEHVKDVNGDAWGTEWPPSEVQLDAGGTMLYTTAGWVFRKHELERL